MSDANLGQKGGLKARYVAGLVLAAAAPFTAVVGVTPLAFAYGNGTGLPATFLLVGSTYLLFAAGMSSLAARMPLSGGLYSLVQMGLGRRIGGAAALIALIAYLALSVATSCLFGVFAARIAADQAGVLLPWQLWSGIVALLVFGCGRRGIEFNGMLLLGLMTGEVLLLLSLAFSILTDSAPATVTGVLSSPFAPGLGASLIFIVTMFLGFEATAIFSGEMRDAKHGIPRATAGAVVLISAVYFLSTWAIAAHFGGEKISAIAAADPAGLYRAAFVSRFGALGGQIADCVLLMSLFACLLAIHSSISQYQVGLARDGLAPQWLEFRHPVFRSPIHGGLVQTLLMTVLLIAAFFLASDPFAIIAPAGALSAIAILLLQIMVSASAVRFFSQETDRPRVIVWLVAPTLAGIALAAAFCLTAANLPLLAGGSMVVSIGLIGAILAVGSIGAVHGIRNHRYPDVQPIFGSLGENRVWAWSRSRFLWQTLARILRKRT